MQAEALPPTGREPAASAVAVEKVHLSTEKEEEINVLTEMRTTSKPARLSRG